MQVHPAPVTPPRPPIERGSSTGSFSIRIAVALNSAVPDFGSVASIVRRVGLHLVGEVQRHEREARPQRAGDGARAPRPRPRRDDTSTPLAFARPRAPRRRPADSSIASGRRSGEEYRAGLHARVVRVEPAARRQPDRELVGELVDRRLVDDDAERRLRPLLLGIVELPQARVEELRAAGVPRPSTATATPPQLLEAAPRTCRVCIGESDRSSSHASCARELAPVVAEPLRELRDDPDVVLAPRPAGRAPCGPAARAAPSSSRSPRTRTRRSAAGSTTSAISAVFVITMSCTIKRVEVLQQLPGVVRCPPPSSPGSRRCSRRSVSSPRSIASNIPLRCQP